MVNRIIELAVFKSTQFVPVYLRLLKLSGRTSL